MEINPIKYLTIERLINILKVLGSFQLSKVLRKPIVWGFPISYTIEPTNHCNLKCPECPSGLGTLTRPLGLMNVDLFKKFVDEISNSGFYLQLFFQGEPYINKNLPAMIEYAHLKNMYVSVSTNGTFINDKNIDEIFLNAPDKLIFSIDGLDEATYQVYRVGGTFKQADSGLRALISKKKQKNSLVPFIELQFIVMQHNEHQLEEVIKYGKNIGVDKITFKTMQVSTVNNAKKFLPSQEKYTRYKVNDLEVKLKHKLKNHCFALWRTSVVTWDGKIVPCCFDKDAEYIFGTIITHSFKEIWKSSSYNLFRKRILDSRKEINICNNCTEGLKMNILEVEN